MTPKLVVRLIPMLAAIACITWLEYTALVHGFNHVELRVAEVVIAGLGGYTLRSVLGDNRD